jgi:hypothetical protein
MSLYICGSQNAWVSLLLLMLIWIYIYVCVCVLSSDVPIHYLSQIHLQKALLMLI